MKNTTNNAQNSSSHANDFLQKSGVNDMLSRTGLTDLPQKLQQFGSTAMDRVNSLSTTQKVVGGTLLALGAGWVTMNSMKGKNILGQQRSQNTASKRTTSNQNVSKSPNISPRTKA